MATIRGRLAVLAFLTPMLVLLLTAPGVEAQENSWSFVFTPQMWLENIRSSGFGATGNIGGGTFSQGAVPVVFIEFPTSAFSTPGAEPTSPIFPQWGGQFAAQYGPWTFGVAAQYISFETSQPFFIRDLTVRCPIQPVICTTGTTNIDPRLFGAKFYTENIRTDRVDVDLTATHFFADVIPDILDVTTGLGFKYIRASGQRSLSNTGAHLLSGGGQGVPSVNYILKSCGDKDAFVVGLNIAIQAAIAGGPFNIDPGNCLRNRASFLDVHYAMTIPTTLNFHLTRNGKWLLPITMAPLLGYEERTDQVLGYENSFVYGGTFDVGLRYIFETGVALYAGWRAQVIQGNNLFFAQGPLFNLSVRFGGK